MPKPRPGAHFIQLPLFTVGVAQLLSDQARVRKQFLQLQMQPFPLPQQIQARIGGDGEGYLALSEHPGSLVLSSCTVMMAMTLMTWRKMRG